MMYLKDFVVYSFFIDTCTVSRSYLKVVSIANLEMIKVNLIYPSNLRHMSFLGMAPNVMICETIFLMASGRA